MWDIMWDKDKAMLPFRYHYLPMNPRKVSSSKFNEMSTKCKQSSSVSPCVIIILFKQMNFFFFFLNQLYLPSPVPPRLVHHPETHLSSLFSPRTAANMWFHLSSSEIKAERNRLMVICLSLPLFLHFLLTVAGPDERTCIFCFSFKFHCPKKKNKKKKTADVGSLPHLHKNAWLKK